jgi:hypothetical protein
MRAQSLVFVLAVAAGCSSASPDATDAGPIQHHRDSGASKHADTGAHHDAGTLCHPAAKDAGQPTDGASEGGEAGKDGAPLDAPVEAHADAAADAGVDAGCEGNCAIQNPAAYALFFEYQLTECGCTATGACYSACHTATSAGPSSACGACLAAQSAEGLSSTCTLAAAADCSMDATCSPFQECAGKCPM